MNALLVRLVPEICEAHSEWVQHDLWRWIQRFFFSSSSASRQTASNSISINTKEIEWKKVDERNGSIDLSIFCSLPHTPRRLRDSTRSYTHSCTGHKELFRLNGASFLTDSAVSSSTGDHNNRRSFIRSIVIRSFNIFNAVRLYRVTFPIIFFLFRISSWIFGALNGTAVSVLGVCPHRHDRIWVYQRSFAKGTNAQFDCKEFLEYVAPVHAR